MLHSSVLEMFKSFFLGKPILMSSVEAVPPDTNGDVVDFVPPRQDVRIYYLQILWSISMPAFSCDHISLLVTIFVSYIIDSTPYDFEY